MKQMPIRNESEYVISYTILRRAVGILGIALPVVLLIGYILRSNLSCPLPPSISNYFYTGMSTYFTGTLCAVALFLYAYKGPEAVDRRAAVFAAVCALGVAFCPVNTIDNCCSCVVTLGTSCIRNAFHYSFAALLFATFAYFSLCLFTKTNNPTNEKLKRNKIYKVCGWTIIASMICVPVFSKFHIIESIPIWTYIFETVALFAFGFSWLVKGETIFRDK
jgi:hypothetical protein